MSSSSADPPDPPPESSGEGELRYKRILLKLSGEALMGPGSFGIDTATIVRIAGEIKAAAELGVQLAVVIGGGNIFRGVHGAAGGMDRAAADYMGMIATVINGLALQDALEKQGVQTRVQTAFEMAAVAEPYIRRRAIRHLERGRVVVLTAGTGNPFFTTDTAAALRAAELRAEVILKGTQVDGVYDRDPVKHEGAKRYECVHYDEALRLHLGVMDATAISLCSENSLPIRVFALDEPRGVSRIALGEELGTLVSDVESILKG